MRFMKLVILSLVLAPVGACGVQEHPWGQKPVTRPATSPTGTAGTTGTGGSGGPMTGATGQGGSDVPVGGGSGGTVGAGGAGGSVSPGSPDGVVVMEPSTLPEGVPKEKMIALIHFGHSNMAGRGEGPAALRPFFFETTPRGWMYHVGKEWELVREPFSGGDSRSISGNTGGPGTAIIKTALAAADPDYHFVSLGYGKNSAYCSQYLPGSIYYPDLMAPIKALKGKVTFGAIFLMLGITERHGTPEDITGYPTCINKLATMIRDEVGAPDLPLLLTDYEVTTTGALSIQSAFARSIMPYIQMVPTVVKNSAIVPTDDLNLVDDHHFELDGHKIWAERAIEIMKTKGWFLWGAAP